MPRRPEILEACQDYGLVLGRTLIEVAGWRTRGSETFNPEGSVNHHTAGPRVGVFPSLNTLVHGRSDLPGPLCNGGVDRNNGGRTPRVHLIAAGRANHAGLGGWAGLTGNSKMWGLEVEHSGSPDEPVTNEQWDIMYRWHAACMDVSGKSNASTVCQHFEWAPNRKVDFVKAITNPTTFRERVNQVLKGGGMAFTPEQEQKIVTAATLIVDGAPMYGVPPTGVGVARVLFHLDGVKVTGQVENPLKTVLLDQMKKDTAALTALINGIPAKVVAALPPSSGGGLTPEQVEAACEKAIQDSGLLGLLPGQ